MLKLRVVIITMLPIRRRLRKNLRSTLRTLGTLRKILLLRNMVVRVNLGCKNLCLFQVRNKSQRRKNTTIKFCEWMKPLFLQIPLTDAIKLPPYSKYMKDIVSNKRKIPNEEISTLLANYSFNGKDPKKLGDPCIPTIPCSIKNNYVRTALCDLGARVSVMPFSLYKRLCLEKLIPTDISL